MRAKKIVTIGGGTGTHMLLSGLKRYVPQVELSAIVTVADDGGSTGRLRDAFGFLPVGDFRMALTALAGDDSSESLLRDLFQYRFSKGEGLAGHNFGNLLLTALTDILGSEEQALAAAGRLLHASGNVIPVAGEKLKLHARYADGTEIRGESLIDENASALPANARIEKVWIEPEVPASRFARQAIDDADAILLGPGDLYTSTIANLVVPGIKEAISHGSGKLIVLVSLMTKSGQTGGMKASDYVAELERYAGRQADVVLMNSTALPREVLDIYSKEGEYPFKDDMNGDTRVVRADLLREERIVRANGDILKRSLLRHDSAKVASAIVDIFGVK